MKRGKNMKRIISLLVAIATALSMGVVTTSALTAADEYTAKVVNPPGMELFWVSVSDIKLDISFSGSTASCSGRIAGNANVNSITATFTLKRVNTNGTTTTVKTWNESSSSRTLNFSGTYSPVSSGQTYRLEVSATAKTTSGGSESVSDSFTKKY